jgi:serine/threonine protein kinase
VESSEFTSNELKQSSHQVLIGRGGFCDLYRVMVHSKFHVLKKLKPEHTNSPQYIDSLRREFEIGYQLDHPNIVRYLKIEDENNTPSILLEFIDGCSITDAINKELITLSIESKKKIIRQLCNALEYLHSKQIYHLDLKPDNLMLTFRGKNLKVIDFGLAMTDAHKITLGKTVGFSAPEQSENKYDVSNDVFSIGKVIEFILSNESDKIKSDWSTVIHVCTLDEPNSRYSSIDELTKEIEKVTEKSKPKIVLIASIAVSVMIIAIVLFLNNDKVGGNRNDNQVQPEEQASKVYQKESIDAPVVESTTKIVREAKVVFTKSEAIYCTQLGSSLYDSFITQYNKSDKSIKAGSQIQSNITDSIQTAWFKYSSKFEVGSLEYKSAYDAYFPTFTESQKKIMEYLYGSK